MQIPSLAVHERSSNGQYRTRLPLTVYNSRLQLDLIQHRSLWVIPRLQAPSQASLVATTPHVDDLSYCARIRWTWHGNIGRRSGICGARSHTGRRGNTIRNGRDQLVADRLAEIQERDTWAVGSGKAGHSTALGLIHLRLLFILLCSSSNILPIMSSLRFDY